MNGLSSLSNLHFVDEELSLEINDFKSLGESRGFSSIGKTNGKSETTSLTKARRTPTTTKQTETSEESEAEEIESVEFDDEEFVMNDDEEDDEQEEEEKGPEEEEEEVNGQVESQGEEKEGEEEKDEDKLTMDLTEDGPRDVKIFKEVYNRNLEAVKDLEQIRDEDTDISDVDPFDEFESNNNVKDNKRKVENTEERKKMMSLKEHQFWTQKEDNEKIIKELREEISLEMKRNLKVEREVIMEEVGNVRKEVERLKMDYRSLEERSSTKIPDQKFEDYRKENEKMIKRLGEEMALEQRRNLTKEREGILVEVQNVKDEVEWLKKDQKRFEEKVRNLIEEGKESTNQELKTLRTTLSKEVSKIKEDSSLEALEKELKILKDEVKQISSESLSGVVNQLRSEQDALKQQVETSLLEFELRREENGRVSSRCESEKDGKEENEKHQQQKQRQEQNSKQSRKEEVEEVETKKEPIFNLETRISSIEENVKHICDALDKIKLIKSGEENLKKDAVNKIKDKDFSDSEQEVERRDAKEQESDEDAQEMMVAEEMEEDEEEENDSLSSRSSLTMSPVDHELRLEKKRGKEDESRRRERGRMMRKKRMDKGKNKGDQEEEQQERTMTMMTKKMKMKTRNKKEKEKEKEMIYRREWKEEMERRKLREEMDAYHHHLFQDPRYYCDLKKRIDTLSRTTSTGLGSNLRANKFVGDIRASSSSLLHLIRRTTKLLKEEAMELEGLGNYRFTTDIRGSVFAREEDSDYDGTAIKKLKLIRTDVDDKLRKLTKVINQQRIQ